MATSTKTTNPSMKSLQVSLRPYTFLCDTNILKVSRPPSTLKSDSRTLLPGFSTPENSARGTPSSDDTVQGGLFVKTENGQNELNDDDELGVFTRGFKRPKHIRQKTNIHRTPTLTQQGHRLPKHLRTGYHRGQQDIIMGGASYQEFDYTPTPSRRSSTPSYGRVHTTSPATSLIPTGGRGFLVTHSFMTSTQRKRLEQQEKIETALTDLEECIAACPTDVKLRGKFLHLQELQRRLEKNENTFLKGQESGIIKDVEKMLSRRRMNMVKAEFESQARAMVENMSMSSPAGTQGRKRAYDRAMGSLSPLSSSWSETVVHSSEGSSFSSSHRPTTGGKTVGREYYQRHKRGKITSDMEAGADADDDGEAVYDDGHGRKTYGGKTIAQPAQPVSDFELAKMLTEAADEEEANDEGAEKDSGDDVDESSEDDTDDERGTDGKGKEDDVDGKGTGEKNGNDEMQKETD